VNFKKSLLLLGLFFILSGCAFTKKISFDESLPEEQQCTLEIPFELTVTDIDGTNVNWKVSFWEHEFGVKKIIVKIPAGKHILTVDYFSSSYYGSWYTTSTANDLKVEYDFQPGVNYKLTPKIVWNYISIVVEAPI